MVLLMIAGIDTSWSAIGAALWHLARNDGDRRRLVREPALMDTAIEEFLRAYAPVTMARLVAKDCDFHGHQLREGDWLLLPFPAANRDPAVFPDADRVLLDRSENRHAAFGLGRHRCLGSNLARMELRVAVEEWLARYPEFELADPAAVRWSGGQIRGPRELPVRITALGFGSLGAAGDRAEQFVPDQARAAEPDQHPVRGEPPPARFVGGRDAGLGGQHGAGAAGGRRELEAHRGLGPARFGERGENRRVLRVFRAADRTRAPELRHPAQHDFVVFATTKLGNGHRA